MKIFQNYVCAFVSTYVKRMRVTKNARTLLGEISKPKL